MVRWRGNSHEIEETTRASYEQYARVHLSPAFGEVPVGKVSMRLLEPSAEVAPPLVVTADLAIATPPCPRHLRDLP